MYEFNVAEQTESCVNWIKEWISKNGNENTKVVIGISGGKDSTVVAALCVEALGKDRVFAVQMPCGVQVDIADSENIIKHLGIKSVCINIGESYASLTKVISEKNIFSINDVYTTNTPARIRMTTLFGIAALFGNAVVVNTCNRSEDVVGYSTFGGDNFGSFAPVCRFTTEEVVAIGDYLKLPYNLVHKIPSDGMSLNEDGSFKGDEQKLGVLYHEINQIIRNAEKTANFDKVMNLYKKSRFKIDIVRLPCYEPKLPDYFMETFGL